MTGWVEEALRSRRLAYRLPQEADKPFFWSLLTDAGVTEPAGFLPLKRKAELDDFLAGLCRDSAGAAIVLEEQPIGYVRVYPEEMDGAQYAGRKCLGLGFAIGKPWQRQGYGTEMLLFITGYLKARFASDQPLIVADAFVDNAASNRLIRKCGFRYVEDYTMYFDALGREMTCHSYIC